jgi:NADH-quinone oxidoreductase subunit N
MSVNPAEWVAIWPALILIITGMLVVGVDMFLPLRAGRTTSFLLSIAAIVSSGFVLGGRLLNTGTPAVHGFKDAIVLDQMAEFLSVGILAATLLVALVGFVDTERRRIPAGEFFGLVLLSASGMVVLVEANDFLTIFISLEIMSIALYVLTGITRRNPRSNEAAVKYLVTGAFATGFLLLGIAFVYGATGTIHLGAVASAVSKAPGSSLFDAGVGLILVGFAFKVGAVPFHMWVADVYEGAPTITTMFMAVTVKAAGFGALIRILLIAFPASSAVWAGLLWWLAVATMVLGNLLAVQQDSVKRMLAFSSVAHTGYALVALASMSGVGGAFSSEGATAALFYLLTYTPMTLGAFALLIYVGHEVEVPGHAPEWQDAEHIDDLSGLSNRRPWAAFAMMLFLVSLGGIPPTAGFVGKLGVFGAAVRQGHLTLAVIGVMASLVSMYYYLKVIVAMYMTESVSSDEKPSFGVGAVVLLAAAAVLALGVLPDMLLRLAELSIKNLAG